MIKRERPDVLHGMTRKIKTGCGNLYVTINEDESGNPIEVFCKLGKTGGCAASQLEAVGRLISMALRGGSSFEDLLQHLVGISCHTPTGFGVTKVTSCSDGVARCLETYIKSRTKETK